MKMYKVAILINFLTVRFSIALLFKSYNYLEKTLNFNKPFFVLQYVE